MYQIIGRKYVGPQAKSFVERFLCPILEGPL